MNKLNNPRLQKTFMNPAGKWEWSKYRTARAIVNVVLAESAKAAEVWVSYSQAAMINKASLLIAGTQVIRMDGWRDARRMAVSSKLLLATLTGAAT